MGKFSKDMSKDEKKLIRQMYWRSFTLYSAVTHPKQGTSGFEYSMLPIIKKFYKKEK